MKYKHLLSTLLLLMLLLPITSAAAFWHPDIPDDEEPPCPYMGVIIEGEGTFPDERFNFTEPEYGFCTDITVEVWILNIEDLYGYEFKLWWDETIFTLVGWVVEEIWEDQFVVRPTDTYAGAEPYHQAVIAVAPSPGITGDFKLATLTFHILNDACWAADDLLGKFDLGAEEARDSCTGLIELCSERDGYWRFIPMQPKIYLTPELEENCVVGETFVMTVMVEDIVKMKSIRFNLTWEGMWWPWLGYNPLICTTEEDIVINEDVFPEAERDIDELTLVQTASESYIYVFIVMNDDFPLINGTFWFMEITFEKQDPWYCGGQPQYEIDLETHEMFTENATTDIVFQWGYFDVLCPDLAYIFFGDCYGDHTGDRGYAIYENAVYIFDPVPGDLTGDGVVDIDDLMIIASLYCFPGGFPDPYSPHDDFPAYPHAFWLHYYDFSGDGHIGLEEIIVVSKNFGRTCVPHVIP